MLTNLLYSEKQLTKKDIKKYLRRISILIRRNEIRRTRNRTTLKYEKTDEKTLEVIQRHETDLIKLNEFNEEKRKYFKCKKVNYI